MAAPSNRLPCSAEHLKHPKNRLWVCWLQKNLLQYLEYSDACIRIFNVEISGLEVCTAVLPETAPYYRLSWNPIPLVAEAFVDQNETFPSYTTSNVCHLSAIKWTFIVSKHVNIHIGSDVNI